MGTINHRTSDYITLAWNGDDIYKYWVKEFGVNEDAIEAAYHADMEDAYYSIKALRNKYDFRFYHVTVEPGYYEDFSIQIENNYAIEYNDCTEKREAQKEITQIRKFLLECVSEGMVSCYPGWCMHYFNREDTLQHVNEAIRAMREEARHTPTFWMNERGV